MRQFLRILWQNSAYENYRMYPAWTGAGGKECFGTNYERRYTFNQTRFRDRKI